MVYKTITDYLLAEVINPMRNATNELEKEKRDAIMDITYFLCDKYREMTSIANFLESKVTDKISTKEIVGYLEEHCPFVDYEEGDK